MGVALHLNNESAEIGSSSFLYAFFSTVAGNLETKPGLLFFLNPDSKRVAWGSRFPVIMKELYQGRLSPDHAAQALKELETIYTELQKLPVTQVIWDLEQRDRRPPWGDEISPEIHNLGEYFVTSDGKKLIAVLRNYLVKLQAAGSELTIS